MPIARRVIVIGLDGLEPSITERLIKAGGLPNLARLRVTGGYARVATTTPAQTPVAWSTFATGVNPGGHGIFDFLRRDPERYLPDLALNRYEQPNAFLPPRAVNLRRGRTIWDRLTDAGIASAVLRCPCTYPPAAIRGRLLAGMGVPDIRGGLGTGSFFTTDPAAIPKESEHLVRLTGEGPKFGTSLVGPHNTRGRTDASLPFSLEVDVAHGTAAIHSDGRPNRLELRQNNWSAWLHVRFKTGMLASTAGMVRFLLVRTAPHVELYASPVNFDPQSPLYPISHPADYAAQLARDLGTTYYTTGMVEDHTGLSNERFAEAEFLAQCDDSLREREAMLHYELSRSDTGFVFCLFDTPDRVQHMFWRFGERDHPANHPGEDLRAWERVIEDHYATCDAIVGRVMEHVDDRTLVVVLSDHGFASFRRGVHLNAWLREHGLLTMRPGAATPDGGDFLRGVDWSRTRAYALGLGSLYLNVKGREGEGIVAPGDADALADDIAHALRGFRDITDGAVAIRDANTRRNLYRGPFAAESPDVVVSFNAGYRVSWSTALGGVPDALVEDNVKKWGGDHIIDPALVPGVLFMNRAFRAHAPRLVDLAPTILAALGVPADGALEGTSLLA